MMMVFTPAQEDRIRQIIREELGGGKVSVGRSPPGPSPQSQGGHARAAVLSPKRRTEIATVAARARWERT